MKVLVLGVSGMLGNAMLRVLSNSHDMEVVGTARSSSVLRHFAPSIAKRIIVGVDVENNDALLRIFTQAMPEVVINCVGLVKQLPDANNPLVALPINAILPHRLAQLCQLAGSRLIHISTDCVFSGKRGGYVASDPSDAEDIYGRSKFLGEVGECRSITLRTSIIGHELGSAHGLIDWFLSQEKAVRGYTRAIFSGLPTVELASVVRDIILRDQKLSGLYHVSSAPISKFDLLRLVADVYGKKIEIVPDESVMVDRSLNCEHFRKATGYKAPGWPELVEKMYRLK